MATTTPPPSPNSTATAPRRSPLVPPEDSIFVRYSPHYELPLSLSTSAAVHAVFLVLVITGVFAAIFMFTRKNEPPPLGQMVEIGGGGGNPQGEGRQAGIGDPAAGPRQEAGPETKDQTPKPSNDQPKPEVKFDPVAVTPEKFPELDGAPEKFSAPTDAMKKLAKVSDSARKKLREGLEPGKGEGGTGRGGGKDTGVGTGQGPSAGPGTGRMVTKRQRRALRWTLMFETRGGQDYLHQIVGLTYAMREKPIIAIPQPNGDFLVFRDVDRPNPVGRIEDIGAIKRIYWVGDEPDSAADIARSLRLRMPPPFFVVFLPEALEQKLLKLELDYGQQHGRNTEEEIQETRFKVTRRPGGACEPHVYEQR